LRNKTSNNTCYECVFLASIVRYLMRMRRIIVLCMFCLSIPHFFFKYLVKYTYDVIASNVLIFGMLDTSHTVTLFSPLRSHNVVHNCDYATFNADCCYGILQHLLRICMSTEASVTVQAKHHHTSSTCRNIFLLLTLYENA
jgi:hypothetical protein